MKCSLLAGAFVASVVTLSAAHAGLYPAPPISVDRDGRYITYHVGLWQLSAEDQQDVVEKSVQFLQNELRGLAAKAPKAELRTLSNFILQPKVMDALTALAQQAVQVTDVHHFRGHVPSAIMIYGGGGGAIGLGAHVAGSVDLGLVIRVEKMIRVDTWNGEREASLNFDLAPVAIPHGHVGYGAGGGLSGTGGIAFIWGKMKSASDFSGLTLGGGGDLKFFLGADGEVAYVRNTSKGLGFMMVRFAGDIGPEADATLDGEGGWIIPLSSYADGLAKANPYTYPASDTTIGANDTDKAQDDTSAPGKSTPLAQAQKTPPTPKNTPPSGN